MTPSVLLLVTDLQIGGTPTVVRELALRLRDPARQVEVACLSTWGPVAEQLASAGVRVTALHATSARHLPAAVRGLRQLLVERRIGTLISFLIHANFVATLAVRALDEVRLIQSIQTTQPRPKWHWWLQGRIQLAADTILVPSRAIVAAAGRRSGIPPERFTVIPNAIDPDDYPPSRPLARAALRVGFIGRIDPVKRVDVAIEAVQQLSGATLEIFGDGAQRAALETRYRQAPAVTWHGTILDPRAALRQVDALVLPSLGEGFGLVLIEAMAAGVPVVASSAGAVPEVVTDGQSGLLIAPGADEPGRFAQALDRLRSDAALRNRLIDNARATVRDRFSWTAVLPRYRALLEGR